MKTVSIRLDDVVYEELGAMLSAIGQTKQAFYESFTRSALRDYSIPPIIQHSLAGTHKKNKKMQAFARLEALRKASGLSLEYDKERGSAMDEKYGVID